MENVHVKEIQIVLFRSKNFPTQKYITDTFQFKDLQASLRERWKNLQQSLGAQLQWSGEGV